MILLESKVLSQLVQDGHQPYLYGSRSKIVFPLFGGTQINNLSEDSDYDYALPYTYEMQEYLERSIGLTCDVYSEVQQENFMSYKDKWTYRVYTVKEDNLQISLKNKFDRFKVCWDNISPEFYWKFINKRSEYYLGKEGVRDFMDIFYHLEVFN